MSGKGGSPPLESLRREKQLLRWERRKLMYLTYVQGYSFSDFVDKISEKYGIKPKALERDWHRRDKWIPILIQNENPKTDIASSLLKLTAIQHAAWETYRTAKKANNHSSMVGAIDKLTRLVVREVEVKQSLGILAKEPLKIDALVTSPRPMEWEQIPEVAEAVAKMREKLRKEKEAAKLEQPT